MIRRGEIRWFRFSAPDKKRPVLVLGREDVFALSEADGLPSPCVLKVEWIRIVDRSHLGPLIATLPEQRWEQVKAALLDVLGF